MRRINVSIPVDVYKQVEHRCGGNRSAFVTQACRFYLRKLDQLQLAAEAAKLSTAPTASWATRPAKRSQPGGSNQHRPDGKAGLPEWGKWATGP